MNTLSLPSSFPLLSTSATRRASITLWIIFAMLFVSLFLIDQYVDYHRMLVPCDGVWTIGESECDWIQLSSAEDAVLQSWGLSLWYYSVYMVTLSMIFLITYVSLGLVILWRMGTTRIGLLVSIALVSIPYSIISASAVWASIDPSLVFPGAVANVVGNTIQVTFLYLLPNGRLSPKWAYIPLVITIFLVTANDLFNNELLPYSAAPIITPIIISFVLLGACLQIYRYFRDSTPTEKQQTRWILLAIVLYVVSIMLWIMVFGRALDIPAGQARLIANMTEWLVGEFLLLLLPFAIAIAILRYKLWNIDIILNRTLVFGGLSALVVLIYTLIVGGTSVLFQSSNNVIVSFIATALIVIVFQPARDRLQLAVNRLMFGERDNPYAVLSKLGQQVQSTAVPSETLQSIVENIATSLKLPYAGIDLLEGDRRTGYADYGKQQTELTELPLRYQNEIVGRLRFALRAGDDAFTPQELQLFSDIAAQIAPVASATRLTMALQNSREQLVLAREEERRRIRRDLHDGMGPTLASQTLQLDAILDMLQDNDASAASEQVKQLKSQSQQMVADIRRLVYELRPPALDELGLLDALRAHISQMNGVQSLDISIEAIPDPLPGLPAAIEVAAYRIVLEAVTNVVRHAQARECQVTVRVTDNRQLSTVTIAVIDDGGGLPQPLKSGIGLTSMRERTAELGGQFEIESHQNTGTHLTAVLPYVTKGE